MGPTHWNMVGRAVTRKRPDKPGALVTSILAVLTFSLPDQLPNCVHVDSRLLQAGHQGA